MTFWQRVGMAWRTRTAWTARRPDTVGKPARDLTEAEIRRELAWLTVQFYRVPDRAGQDRLAQRVGQLAQALGALQWQAVQAAALTPLPHGTHGTQED